MATKVSELVEATVVTGDDLLLIVNSPAANASSQKITVNNFFDSLTIANGVNVEASTNGAILTIDTSDNPIFTTVRLPTFATPANSSYVNATFTYEKGDIWLDADYLYAATSNTEIKRISLSTIP